MPPVVYVVRSPMQTLPNLLLPMHDSTIVLALEDDPLPGRVLRTPRDDGRLREGERLSYEQVLAICIGSEKVVTL
jgi:hypothetical protein